MNIDYYDTNDGRKLKKTDQCGPGSNTRLGISSWLSLLLVLVYLPVFSSRFSGFPPSIKPAFQNSNSIRKARATGWQVVRLLSASLFKQS